MWPAISILGELPLAFLWIFLAIARIRRSGKPRDTKPFVAIAQNDYKYTSSMKHQRQSSPRSADWMRGCLRGVEMSARMTVRRGIAAAYVPALKAHAQVHPLAAGLQALLATFSLRLYIF